MQTQPERDTDADRAATLHLVIALGRSMQAIERGVQPHLRASGLGLTEFGVLEVLYHKGPLALGEIRDRILVTDKVFPAHVDRLRQVTAGLSASEKRAAARLLRRLTQEARHITGERITEDD